MSKHVFAETLENLQAALLDRLAEDGYFSSCLAGSALATATAVYALTIADASEHHCYRARGLEWLARNANADGGWGDTPKSQSNIGTTALCLAAFTACDKGFKYRQTMEKARVGLANRIGDADALSVIKAIKDCYGGDRTFSVPILTMCCLAGLFDSENIDPWREIPALAFELAALPRAAFRWLPLSVVSYALPALIALGHAKFAKSPPGNPAIRAIRQAARKRTLSILQQIQPANGGFLEATPLTSFVVMSLAAAGHSACVVCLKGLGFIKRSMRADGSWPVDTNLNTWVTTLAINALASCKGGLDGVLPPKTRLGIKNWLLRQQLQERHPYTQAAPGGWAWTDLPGGVPDADDTAGAILALNVLARKDESCKAAALKGARWLMNVQNADGGVPTFCRGWTKLPFDRSSPDLTAHALRALEDCGSLCGPENRRELEKSSWRMLGYLSRAQRADGSWVPLWFGNEKTAEKENPVYGTASVVSGLAFAGAGGQSRHTMIEKGTKWLLAAQNGDGSWGGDKNIAGSVEETALAAGALADAALESGTAESGDPDSQERLPVLRNAMKSGLNWIVKETGGGRRVEPAPIGLYFARLWYYERLYPYIFAVATFNKASRLRLH